MTSRTRRASAVTARSRSLAARKAWQTRRENAEFERRSLAARKAWQTRRAAM